MCVCVCVFIYIYTHTHTHTYIHAYLHMCTFRQPHTQKIIIKKFKHPNQVSCQIEY